MSSLRFDNSLIKKALSVLSQLNTVEKKGFNGEKTNTLGIPVYQCNATVT